MLTDADENVELKIRLTGCRRLVIFLDIVLIGFIIGIMQNTSPI